MLYPLAISSATAAHFSRDGLLRGQLEPNGAKLAEVPWCQGWISLWQNQLFCQPSRPLMDSLSYSLVNATAADLVSFVRPYLLAARIKSAPEDKADSSAITDKLDEDLRVASDLSGILKLILSKDEWSGLELAAPRVFTRKFRSDLHQVRDLRNRLAHESFDKDSSPAPAHRLLDLLTFSLYLLAIKGPEEKCSAANSAVKACMAAMMGESPKEESGHGYRSLPQTELTGDLGQKINEWADSQQLFWTQQINKILSELKGNPSVSPGEVRSLEAALASSEKQRDEYVQLLHQYKNALDGAVQKSQHPYRYILAAIVLLGLVVLVIALATDISIKPQTASAEQPKSVRTQAESPRISAAQAKDHMGSLVWVKQLRVTSASPFTSSSGRVHLRFATVDETGATLNGIFFEGVWDEATQKALSMDRPLDIYGKMTTFGGKPSLEASKLSLSK
jgi:hypothetical protein